MRWLLRPKPVETEMLPLTDEDMTTIRAKHIRARLFSNRHPSLAGELVSVRRNLNFWARGGDGQKYSVQTVHKGSSRGFVLGYDYAATVLAAEFIVDQEARAAIAAGRRQKHPMAGVRGFLSQKPASLKGVAIRFNPKTSHLFTRVDNGRAVRAADEVTIFDTRAYARGKITYWNADDAPQALDGIASDALYE